MKNSEFEIKKEPTVQITIFMAGDIQVAKNTCRKYCFIEGLCVTITPTDFIYTGGQEKGFKVGLVNYPRFPSTEKELKEIAHDLSVELIKNCCQWTALIVAPDTTYWITRREKHK